MPVMSLPVPCIRGEHGPDLNIFQTTIGPADLENFLGHDPRGENWRQLPNDLRNLYEYLQRKTSAQRRSGTGCCWMASPESQAFSTNTMSTRRAMVGVSLSP